MIHSKIRKLMFGTSLSQEYICVAKEKLSNQFRVFLSSENGFIDISDEHIFLGYHPLIIGLSSSKGTALSDLLENKSEIKINFGETSDRISAQLTLKIIEIIKFKAFNFYLFKGLNGSHKFLSATYQLTNNLKYKLQAEKKINIYLKGNLLQQVKIAYSIPRKISLVTLGNNSMYNVFPTDVNGNIDTNNFAISLRTTSKANQQVKEQKEIILSEMRAETYNEVYSYGVNHMKELQLRNKFNFSEKMSKLFNLPLLNNIVRYFELEFVNEMTIGIHDILFFRIVNLVKNDVANTLSHIHRDYAQWRINNGLQSEFLFRKS